MYIYQPKTKQLAIQTSTLAPVADPEQNADVFIGELDNKLNVTINNAENVKINGEAITPGGGKIYAHKIVANSQKKDADYPHYDYEVTFISTDSESITDVAGLKTVIAKYGYLPAICDLTDDGSSSSGDALSIKQNTIKYRQFEADYSQTAVMAQWVDAKLEDSANYEVTITDTVTEL